MSGVPLERLKDRLKGGCACIDFVRASLIAEMGVVGGGMSGDEKKGLGAARNISGTA